MTWVNCDAQKPVGIQPNRKQLKRWENWGKWRWKEESSQRTKEQNKKERKQNNTKMRQKKGLKCGFSNNFAWFTTWTKGIAIVDLSSFTTQTLTTVFYTQREKEKKNRGQSFFSVLNPFFSLFFVCVCVCGLFTAHFWLSLPLPLFWLLFRQGHLWPQTKFARYKLENKWSFKPNHAFHVVLINDNTDARYHSHLKKVPLPFSSPFAIMESALDIFTTVKWDIFYLEREREGRVFQCP